MDTLTPSQRHAAEAVLNGTENCLVDGPPGTGKSYVLKVMQDELSRRNVKHATIAPRGECAFIVGGDTVHSKLLPLPRRQPFFQKTSDLHDALRGALAGKLAQADSTRGKERAEFWSKLDVLFIDETFLMDAGLFAFADYTARVERRCDKSFGGLRIVLMGDPCQMGPRGSDIYHPFRPLSIPPPSEDSDDENADSKWGVYGNVCLETRTFTPWSDAQLGDYELTENVRHASDVKLQRVAAAMREGTAVSKMIPETRAALLDRCVDVPPDDALVLYWSREDVANHNRRMNDRIGGETVKATLGVTVRSKDGEELPKRPATEDGRELRRMADEFIRKLPMEGELVLRDSTRVMIETNIDIKAGAYRGATGKVVSVDRDDKTGATSVTVLLDMTSSSFVVKHAEESVEHAGLSCKIIYFPLSYGYAKTYDGIQVWCHSVYSFPIFALR